MKINELFVSIDGESKRAGELAIFIRSVGCNLRCKFCDSKYTWGTEPTNKDMSPDDIVKWCIETGIHNVTFTGGEPLIQQDSDELLDKLSKAGFDIGIETDGGIDFTSRPWFIKGDPNIWVCADYKCYASGMTGKMLSLDIFARLRPQDVLKFVVGSTQDLELAQSVIQTLRGKGCDCYFYLSPVFGDIKPVDIVEFMMKNKMQHKIRFQLQLHKFVWDPNKRAV